MSASLDSTLLGDLRQLAQSILGGIQELETMTLDGSWDDARAHGYLTDLRIELSGADATLAGTLSDFAEPMVP